MNFYTEIHNKKQENSCTPYLLVRAGLKPAPTGSSGGNSLLKNLQKFVPEKLFVGAGFKPARIDCHTSAKLRS